MIIGVLKDIKEGEARVIMTPIEVAQLISCGHEVLVQKDAGLKAGFSNEDYLKEGAKIVNTMAEVYKYSQLVCKVKEMNPIEYDLIKENQIIFTCIHPAADKEQVDNLLKKKAIALTAEDTHRYGSPNCEVAGKVGALMGVYHLFETNGGMGKLICGVGGAPASRALIIGGGIVGRGALDIISSLGAFVTLMDINVGILRDIKERYPKNVETIISNKENIKRILPEMDLVINCVKWPKHRKDHLIDKDMLKIMKKKSVIVDISADKGGAIETYKPTTHEKPIYEVNGVIHYGVDNIPAAVPHSTSIAYAASIFPHIKSIANLGLKEALKRDGYLRRSLTTYKGILTHEETGIIQNRSYETPESVLKLEDDKNIDYAPKATSTRK